MSALFFILRKQIKNVIRGLTSKPIALIGYIFVGILMALSLAVVLFMPSATVRHGGNELFRAIFTGLILVVMYFSIRMGVDKGSSYFRASDVNMVFVAPIRPSQVLLYGFIKHMGTSLLVVIFTIFQIPNVKNNFELTPAGVWVILLAVLFYSLIYPILGMLLYSYTSVSNARRSMAKRVLDVLLVLVIMGFVKTVMDGNTVTDALLKYLNNDVFGWIPIIGQLRTIASSAVYGVDSAFWLSVTILTALIIAFIFVLYQMELDYYEDVLGATDQMEMRIQAKRKGRDSTLRNKKARKVKGGFSASGAMTIFEKHLLEYRKMSFFFLIDRNSFIILAASVLFKFGMPDNVGNILMSFFFSVYMLFFFVVQGKWPLELDKPYIFLIPSGTGEKLFYSTLTENLKNLVDGVLIFVICGFIYRAKPMIVLLCIISYALYGAIYIYGDIVSRRLFGNVHSKALQIFVKMFVSFVVIIPGIIMMLIAIFSLESDILGMLLVTAWNLIVVVGMFLAAKGVFKNLEAAA